MSERRPLSTRRAFLAESAALVGVTTAGCSGPSASSRSDGGTGGRSDTPDSTVGDDTTDGSIPAEPNTLTGGSTATPISTSSSTTERKDRWPVLNATEYPVAQQRTDGRLLPERPVLLASRDWRARVARSKLTASTREFLRRTEFDASFVVGFELEVTTWGYHLRLEDVERTSTTVRIAYMDVFVEGGPNVEQDRAMFVRLPRRDDVPDTVTLRRIDR